MSSTLKIEPAHRKRRSLSHELKLILQKKFGGCIHERLMDENDIPYLHALVDMELKDAQVVIDMIEKFGEVVLDEEF